MFFLETMKLFFSKENKIDLIGLLVGLIMLFIFAYIMMPNWPFIFFTAAMVFTSTLYFFIMVDEAFLKNDNKRLNKNNVLDYIISKNLFVIIFSSSLFGIVMILSSAVNSNYFDSEFLTYILIYNLFTLGADKIIFIFHNNPVKSYASGVERDIQNDIDSGVKKFIDQIPSLIIIGIFAILFFMMGYQPSIYFSFYYYIICLITLIYFLSKKKSTKK
ncbi:MAG TPA: hypothetical protein DCO62_00400 [Alkalibacterium sp.]|nr:hypothetical protein [Alkalibacterium sp.]